MASGILRPYTLSDVLGSMSTSIGALSASSTAAGTGFFTEADEVIGLTDMASLSTQGNPAWEAGQWSGFTWG